MKTSPLFTTIFLSLLFSCKQAVPKLDVSFVSSNIRFVHGEKFDNPNQKSTKLRAWKGQKVNIQLAVFAGNDISELKLGINPLKNVTGNKIDNIKIGFVDFLMSDKYKAGCSANKTTENDSLMVADLIDDRQTSAVKANSIQPIWITVNIPQNAQIGDYKGSISVNNEELHIEITVIDRTLPPPAEWTYDLDLWQHPAAIARVHKLNLWSDEHFAAMKPYYQMLAAAGQKNITTSIINEPWGHQTYDDFPSLIKWTKKKEGTWTYDYQLFDKYVAFVMDCGINKRINCYTMIPWSLKFSFFDEALQKDTAAELKTTSAEYKILWKTMLTDFTKHLKQKGWFEKTSISVDERAMADMKIAIGILKEVDPNWKVALAGDYHAEIEDDIFDYSLASRLSFDEKTLQIRKAKGMPSTFYTCCVEEYPNGFTSSPPADHVWMGWYAASKGLTGYLRWAFNSWTANPNADSRYTSWPAGDTYQIYPGPKSSIRFEKLIEGIQDFEKIHLLKKAFIKEKNEDKLAQLNKILKSFQIEKLNKESSSLGIIAGQEFVNQ